MILVNLGIPLSELTDKQLLTEHEQIKRLPMRLKKYGVPKNLPPSIFSTGYGHVTFCIWIGKYTNERYVEIFTECYRRGLFVTNHVRAWRIYLKYPLLYNSYQPTMHDKNLIIKKLYGKKGKQVEA